MSADHWSFLVAKSEVLLLYLEQQRWVKDRLGKARNMTFPSREWLLSQVPMVRQGPGCLPTTLTSNDEPESRWRE